MKYLVIIRHKAFGQIFGDLAKLCKTEDEIFPSHTIIHKDNGIDVLIVTCDDIKAAREKLIPELPIGFDLEIYEVKQIEA